MASNGGVGSVKRRKRLGFALAVLTLLLQAIFVVHASNADGAGSRQLLLQSSPPPGPAIFFEEKHSEGYCAMYGICGKRSDGKALNCPNNTPSVKPDSIVSSKIQSLCPTITGNICCTEAQFDNLRNQVQPAVPLLVSCPACLRNFLNFFCEMSCSPNQSLFINVTSVAKAGNNMTVDAVDFYIADTYSERVYESCKDVKFGTMNMRAMALIGGNANNFKEFLAFLGLRAAPYSPGSTFAMNFPFTINELSGMKPLNVSTYSCGDTSLGCSCGDCPSSFTCSSSAPHPVSKGSSCSVTLGSLKVKCIDLSLAIIYIVLVSTFLGWGIHHRAKKGIPAFKIKPSPEVTNGRQISTADFQKGDNVPMQVHVQLNEGAQLSIVQGYLARFFRQYGSWIARNPAVVLCSSVVLVLLLCIGLVQFKVETRPEKLWVGPGSSAAKEKEFFDNHLAPFYRIEQLIISTVPDTASGISPSIVNVNNIKLLFDIQKKVDSLRANYSGSVVSLTDICVKPLGKDCATQSILQFFKMNPETFDASTAVQHAEYCFQHFTSSDLCLSAFKAPLDPATALGGFTGNNYSEASAFVVTYPVNNAVNREGNETAMAVAWEKAFIKLAKEELLPLVSSNNLTLSFSTESSIEEELKRESTADVMTIVISYLVMFAYISLTLGDTTRLSLIYISSKVLLGLSGVMLVILSVLGSVGFFSAVGLKSTLIIMEVIPFLVLAVGVDNMCILVHAVKRQPRDMVLEGRVSNALAEVGPSITLSSLSEVLAFAVGSFIPMPACRVFSMFAALAVLLDFLLQITAFVALIIFDSIREDDGRVDCFPCLKTSATCTDMDKGIRQRKPGLLTRYMKEIHAPILSIWGVKILVISVFVALAAASIGLSTRLEPGLDQNIVLPKDSYLQGYFNDVTEYLRIGPPLYFVVKNYNYSSQSRHTNQLCSISQCNPDSLLNEIVKASMLPESSYIAKPAASWLDDFLVWMSPEAFGCCRKFTNGSYCPPDDQPPCCASGDSLCNLNGVCKDCTMCFRHSDLQDGRPSTSQFREKLPWFLSALPSSDCAKGGHGAYTNSLDLQGFDSGIIQASEFRTYHTPLNKQVDYVNSMRAAREFSSRMSKSLEIEIFPYSVFYIYFEQYLSIWEMALISLSIAIGTIFLVCLAITCSFWSAGIIILVIVMIIVDLLGIMAILNIQLNAMSVVNLVMAVGIAVEFCVHITHAFSVASGDRDQRTKEALGTMGASVFSGITLTKIVGVIVLGFSKTEVFVIYYFQIYLALVILGFLHGLVFLPVVLSMFGPPSRRLLLKKGDNNLPAPEPQP